jgi:hypothetical protein
MEKKKIENIEDLRNSMLDVYEKIRSAEIGVREAKEYANVAGKIIASAKLQLEYNAYMKTQAKIKFLDVE